MKKTLSIILSVLIFSFAAVNTCAALDFPVVTDETYTLGDVNGDGQINAIDSQTLKLAIVGIVSKNFVADSADFDGDGVPMAMDAYKLKTVIAGKYSADHFDNGRAIYKLTLGGIDISEFCVVVDENANKDWNSHYAAEELITYIHEASGVELELCYGKASATKDHKIVFTQYAYQSEAGSKYGREGYNVKTENGNMYIEGTDRGTMYAVYDILREHLGFRFSTTEYVFIYMDRVCDIPDGIDKTFVPRLNFRYTRNNAVDGSEDTCLYHFFPEKLNGSQLSRYEEKTRYGRLVGPYIANAHSMAIHYKMGSGTMPEDDGTTHIYERYDAKYDSGIDKNPENTWQPCARSDYKIIFEGLRDNIAMRLARADYLDRDPDISFDGQRMASFSIEDNALYCTCRFCNNFAVKDGEAYSGLYIDMTNRAVEEIQQYFPGTKLYMILYSHVVPKTVRPDSRVVLVYCGNGCNNHALGSGECKDNLSYIRSSNKHDEEMLPKWGEICKQTGSELWWWSYCTTITYSLAGCPNVFETYYDIKYLVDECNVSGIYCEGGGYDYNFEDLKYHMFSWMMYDPDVTFEEYCDEVKDFLYLYYGNGYLELYEYLIMQKAAGDATGCFVNNHNRPGDMYSYDYVKENYEKMRALLTTALEKAEEEMYEKRIEMLIVCCDFMGLSAAYNDMYKNGTEDTRAVYCERYDSMYNYLKDNNLPICDGPYELPAKMSYELTPITQFYDRGSWTVSDWAQDSPIPYKPFAEGYQSER